MTMRQRDFEPEWDERQDPPVLGLVIFFGALVWVAAFMYFLL